MSRVFVRSGGFQRTLGASITEAIRQHRTVVAVAAASVAIACGILALGGHSDINGVKLSGVEEPWARLLLAGVAITAISLALVTAVGFWPRSPMKDVQTPPLDGVPWIDRPEREQLEECVRTQRVSPVIGPSGAGKSRLARELVRSRWDVDPENRPRYVDLRDMTESELLDRLLAETGSGRSRRVDRLGVLATWLGDRPILLVLDNSDWALAGVVAVVTRLTADCPKLSIVLTSQEDPHLGVKPLEVRGLDSPPPGMTDPSEIAEYTAVKMLLALPSTPPLTLQTAAPLAAICMRLEGLPSALTAASNELRYSTPLELDAALAEWSATSSPLRGLLDLAYERMSVTQQRLFRRLSVFIGPFTGDDVIATSTDEPRDDVLAVFRDLVDRQLVMKVPPGDPLTPVPSTEGWFRLMGPFRRYANDLVREAHASDWAELRRWHANVMLEHVERAEPRLTSSERSAALRRLQARARDVDAALRWSSEHDVTILERLSACLFWYWNSIGELQQGEKWLTQALEMRGAEAESRAMKARLEYGLGGIAFLQGEQDVAVALLASAARALAEQPAEARAIGLALLLLGRAELERGELDQSLQHGADALRSLESTEERWTLALALNDHAERLAATGEWQAARRHYSRSLALWDELHDQWGESLTRNNLAASVWRAGETSAREHARAHDHVDRALEIQEENGYTWGIAWSYRNRGELHLCAENVEQARRAFRESLERHHRIGRLQLVADCVDGLGRTALRGDHPVRAAKLLAGAEHLRRALSVVQWPVEAALHDAAMRELTERLSASELERAEAAARDLVSVTSAGELQVNDLTQLALESASAEVGSS